MKYYIAILMIIFSLSGKGQKKEQSFLIQGQFKNLANSAVYLTYSTLEGKRTETAKTDATGNFTIRGKVSEPQLVYLGPATRVPRCTFFLENTQYTLKGDAADLGKAKVKGGKEQVVYDKYEMLLDELGKFTLDMQKPLHYNLKRKDTLGFNTYVNATTWLWKDSLERRQADFIVQYPSSSVSLLAMRDIVASNRPTSTMDSLMRLIEATPIARFPTSVKIRKIIEGRMSTALGLMAPEFSQPDSLGRPVALSGMRGKYVLVDFWASWCAPCRAENPNVLKAYQRYKDSNFTVLAVSIDVDRAKWIKAIKEDKLPWMQLSDLKPANAAARLYGVLSVPRNFLIDPNGKIVAIDLRGAKLEKVLGEFLEKKSK